ncbi:hypothetical protein [Capnocytophaga catalasegens]|uniref:Uncharacterized protein n=1 Tax=Capnocytophaga catalasegens TaxID=1004260 RepID=A0AAV5B0E5_9FLAO|nr:hypothetical protein [Capnocytophaga catalasegens]GIZ14625.1 hypothetical protein RCZ03_06260 [Capnocytophaga catalasegens]GJM50827.1 hypothetical protein RCZ15_18000 [Capnocytophaga catalasegens]GJM51980.1 hypothetical protein RCZ16_02980 [Capnocytophaga catalasegens]
MNKIDPFQIKLIDCAQPNTLPPIDFAGFPPFIRGNNVLNEFPKIIDKQELTIKTILDFAPAYQYKNQLVVQYNFFENSLEEITKTLQKIVKYSTYNAIKIGFLIDFYQHNPFEKIALVRALRGIWYILSKQEKTTNNQIDIWSFIDESSFENLPFIVACQTYFLVAEKNIIPYIIQNKNLFYSHTIDLFAGNSLIEEKTYFFINEIHKFIKNQ